MLFFFSVVFLLLIVFSLTIALSRQSNRIKEIAQEVALLEYNLRKYSDLVQLNRNTNLDK